MIKLISVKKVTERLKRTYEREQTGKKFKRQTSIQAVSTRVIPVAGYIMNVCHLGKRDLGSLDKIVRDELRQVNKHGKQASDERLYTEREEGGRGLKSFKDVHKETSKSGKLFGNRK